MQSNYRGVNHPSINYVECPYCKATKGTHCDSTKSMTRRNSQTKVHKARISAYQNLIDNHKSL